MSTMLTVKPVAVKVTTQFSRSQFQKTAMTTAAPTARISTTIQSASRTSDVSREMRGTDTDPHARVLVRCPGIRASRGGM